MKRIRATWNEESEARKKGLERQYTQTQGFDCECKQHISFSPYVLEHWSEPQQHRCIACGRLWRMKAGAVSMISGPNKRPSRIAGRKGADEARDPNKPLWRAYRVFHNSPQPITYGPASDYHDTLDAANDQAWDYATRAEPNNRARREDLFRALVKAEEFPLLSTITADGKIVGSGHLQMIGIRSDEVRQSQVYEFELRDPKGRVTRVSLLPEVWKEIAASLEYEPKKETEKQPNRK